MITDREAYEILSSQMDEIWGILKQYGIDEEFFSEDPAGAVSAALDIEKTSSTTKCMEEACTWCKQGVPLEDPDVDSLYRHTNGGNCDAYGIRIAMDAGRL